MTSANIEVIHRYFAAINAEDWDALARLWHPEAEWRATGARRRIGKDDLLTYYPVRWPSIPSTTTTRCASSMPARR